MTAGSGPSEPWRRQSVTYPIEGIRQQIVGQHAGAMLGLAPIAVTRLAEQAVNELGGDAAKLTVLCQQWPTMDGGALVPVGDVAEILTE